MRQGQKCQEMALSGGRVKLAANDGERVVLSNKFFQYGAFNTFLLRRKINVKKNRLKGVSACENGASACFSRPRGFPVCMFSVINCPCAQRLSAFCSKAANHKKNFLSTHQTHIFFLFHPKKRGAVKKSLLVRTHRLK